MGATIRVGNLLGAGSPQIAKKVLKLALTITNSIMFTCAFVVFLSRHDFARIYTNDESVREKVADVVNVYGEFPHVCCVCVCVCMCVSFTCVRSCACFRWHFSLCSLTLRVLANLCHCSFLYLPRRLNPVPTRGISGLVSHAC